MCLNISEHIDLIALCLGYVVDLIKTYLFYDYNNVVWVHYINHCMKLICYVFIYDVSFTPNHTLGGDFMPI